MVGFLIVINFSLKAFYALSIIYDLIQIIMKEYIKKIFFTNLIFYNYYKEKL
jgi:hypothetical protein